MVIGAPYSVSEDLMEHFSVDVVCHGTTPIALDDGNRDAYAVPKSQGKFHIVESSAYLEHIIVLCVVLITYVF